MFYVTGTLQLQGNKLSGTLLGSLSLKILQFQVTTNNFLYQASAKDLKVQYFNIKANEVQGPLPEDLFQMKGTIRLSANQFTGTLPRVGAAGSDLTFLGVSANKIVGQIPPGK